MIRRPPRSTQSRSSAASDVYKRQAPSCGKPREKAHQETAAALAVISSIQGGVQVRIAGSDAWLAGSTGTAIYEGDSIQTEAQGKLGLLLTDGAKVQLNQNTFFRFVPHSGKTTEIEITRGEVWVEKSPSLKGVQLKTPAALATVSYTHLR